MPPPPPPAASTTSSKNKKKKKKKKGANASISIPASGTSSVAGDDDDTPIESSNASTPFDEVKPVFNSSQSGPIPHDDSYDQPLTATEEQPDFGAHSVPSSHVTQPAMGVPAPMSNQAAKLFADDGEEVAFLDSSNPVDNVYEDRDAATAAGSKVQTSDVGKLPAGASTILSGPADDLEGGAFEVTTPLDSAMEEAGREHAAAAAAAKAASKEEPSGSVAEPVSSSAPVSRTTEKPSSASAPTEAAPSSTPAAATSTTAQPASTPSAHQPWMPSDDKKDVVPILPEEAESIAYEAPSFGDVLSGDVDVAEARADDVSIPQAPKELGKASALFADDEETEAFLPDGPPLETFAPDYPPVGAEKAGFERDEASAPSEPTKKETESPEAPSATVPSAQALFAGESESAFDLTPGGGGNADKSGADTVKKAGAAVGAGVIAAGGIGAASQLFADDDGTGAFLPEGDDLPTFEPDYPPVAPSSAKASDIAAPASAPKTEAPAVSARAAEPPKSESSEEPAAADASKSAPPAVPTAQSLFSGEAESIAFDIPTGDDAMEGDVDLGEARRDGVPTPAAPKELGAASHLFADDNETEAFLPDGGDLQTFEPDFPPKPPVATEDAKDETKTRDVEPKLSAQALFAEDDDSAAFDIQPTPSEDVPSDSTKPAAANTSAAALFADEGESAFDISSETQDKAASSTGHIPGSTSDRTADQRTESLEANQSIQSMFSNDKTQDWFVDTSIDDTLDLGRDDQETEEPMSLTEELEYDESQVPQGWYNDDGEFQWYTDEEREAVRASMIADGSLVPKAPKAPSTTTAAKTQPAATSATQPSQPVSNPYDPSAYNPPQQYSATSPTGSYFRQQHSSSLLVTPGLAQASPYAPAAPTTAPSVYSPAVPAPYAAAPSPYAPAVPYGAPAAPSPYDPYAPTTAAAAPYAGVAKTPAQATPPPPPEPPKRMKSTAYDPPLRPAKSFAGRPKSTAPSQPEAFQSPVVNEAPPAPPPGPPKRSKTEQGGFAGTLSPPQQPPTTLPARSYSEAPATQTTAITNPYDPAPTMAYEPASYTREPTRSLSPPVQPPPRPATSSSSHPPKPTSFDPPLRPTSSRPPSRHASRPNFQPAPVTSPFPTSEPTPPVPSIPAQYSAPPKAAAPPKAQPPAEGQPIVPPLRGPSRGATRSRASSPKYDRFEAAPPVPPLPTAGRGSQPPRVASPLGSSSALGVPPRVPSPLKNEVRPAARHAKSISVHSEFDPEGGGVWDEGESEVSHAPPVHSTPKGTTHDDSMAMTGSPPTSYEAIPLAPEMESFASGSYSPPPADDDPAKTPVARKVENPYAPSMAHPMPPNAAATARAAAAATSPLLTPRPPLGQRQPSKPEAAESRAPATSLGDAYAPSTTSAHDPYAPNTKSGAQDPYAPQRSSSTSADYNPYAPASPKRTTQPPAMTSPKQKASPYMPASRVSESPKKTSLDLSRTSGDYAPRTSGDYAPRTSGDYAPRTSGDYARPVSQPRSGHQYKASDPYAPSQPSHSRQTSVQDPYNPYAPASSQTQADPYNPYAPSAPQPPSDPYNPYAATPASPVNKKQEPYNPYSPTSTKKESFSTYEPPSSDYNPYAPSKTSPQQAFSSYMASPPTIGGALPGTRTSAYDPYAPKSATTGPTNDLYAPGLDNAYGQRAVSPPQPNYFQSMGPLDSTYVPQQVLEQRPVSEDPLGRCAPSAHNIPLAVFGFGGVLITKFPGSADDDVDAPSYGYASHRGLIHIRPIAEVAETTALSTNSVSFPGPLVFDPATPKGAAGDKKRREAVLSYLSARTEEIERGLPYLKSNASVKRRDEEAKLVMMRILTALVEGDGRVFGTPKAEEAIRAALQPPATVQPVPLTNGLGSKGTAAAASPAQLQQLSNMMLDGDKKEAALFAANAGLWSHALVLSSAVGPDLWREIVARFSKAELSHDPKTAALQSAYSVFGGITPETIDNLFAAANITDDPGADQWREVVGGVLFNSKPTDLVCFDDLGSRFQRAGLYNAAQICFLLSPNSPFSDMSPAATDRPIKLVENPRDEDGAIFAEIAEYARSLVPTPKGAEVPHASLPMLIPIKLARAWRAAELGDVEQAKRYCEAIEAAAKPTKHARPMISRHVAASMEDLLERLTGEPSASPAAGLGMRKGKSGASLGSWIEGRLTKFIAGEDEAPEAKPKPEPKVAGVPVGPFSHFSTISPGPSAGVSRAGSSVDVPVADAYNPAHAARTDSYDSGYQPWGADEDSTTPQAVPTVDVTGDDSEFINPMASLSLGPTPVSSTQDDYKPAARAAAAWDEDDDDLGFGNSSLSRGRTPKAPEADAAEDKPKAEAPKAAESKEKDKDAQASGKGESVCVDLR